MDKTLNDIAPYPQDQDEVTAEKLTRNLAVYAQANFRWMLDDASDGKRREAMMQVVNLYGLVKILRAFTERDPEGADEVARELWADWDAGDSLGEWLWEWLTEYGIDPEQVAEAAATTQEEKAA